jgi:hypothetical protein
MDDLENFLLVLDEFTEDLEGLLLVPVLLLFLFFFDTKCNGDNLL